ncbi:hypothetical protein B0H19DRAFT_1056766 [Mycena capillaripes]|nr:hypothetical protein B0H19DRAFT_1056766 [Mycena capillaripes]
MAINSQPEDILREIFKSCLDTRHPHFQPFSPAEAPLLLCGVCMLWRAIAITTSELWAQLSVSFGRESTDKLQPSPQLINAWISRSGFQPLTLVIRDLGLRSSSVDIPNDLLRIFLPHVHRWQSITLFIPNHALPAALMSLESPSSVASMLQVAKFEFAVDAGLHAATVQVAGLSRLFASSTHLHTLYWRNDVSILQFIDIHWAHLTVIDLVPMWRPMSEIVQVMRQAYKLRSLSVFITEACDVDAPIVLPDLLILWIGTEVDVRLLFERLTLPSLLNINIFCENLLLPVPQTAVVECIARSGTRLDVAIFKELRIAESDIIAFLRQSPSLRLFELSNGGEATTVTDETLGLLTARNTPCLCPNLLIIRFLESSISSADGVLADMVASRRPDSPAAFRATPLSRLVVHFSDSEALRHTEDIRRLQLETERGSGFRAWVNEPETA